MRAVGLVSLTGAVALAPADARAQRLPAPPTTERYAVEYYYKVRWGYQAEFLALFRKNHLPILEKQREKGSILDITAAAPRYHATEDGRWDYRVTLVYPNVAAAYAANPITDAELRAMYPDSVAFEREERRRFELLEAHWDVPIAAVVLRP
ncbi:MAG: hypothetical protein M3373_10460 [Gemmatimonadota bacterium]|nr:hypothetical protein [Gemmatimonadota bacterium]